MRGLTGVNGDGRHVRPARDRFRDERRRHLHSWRVIAEGPSMSRIVTFGEVDQRALEQLRRCAEAGDAPVAVLCADHHVGYSQPIGGVVAYENYVSPSGVGYDIACGNKATK